MNHIRLSLRILFFLLLAAKGMVAQNNHLEEARKVMAALQRTYHQAGSVSFDVAYTYASENRPDSILDSARGQLQLQGSNYCYEMQHTVTVRNDRYTILLFEADQLMYISRSRAAALHIDPVAALDSFLRQVPGVKTAVQENNHRMQLELQLPDGLPYKKVTMEVDQQTGFLTRVVYVVTTDQLMEPSAGTGEEYGRYARVEAVFSNYSLQQPESGFFEEASFFTRQNNTLVPVGKYKSYKIFLGSPNL